MIKQIKKFRIILIMTFAVGLMLSAPSSNSFAQEQEDVADPDPEGEYGQGCYTTVIWPCVPFIIVYQETICIFNNKYGTPYTCSWLDCFGTDGSRRCVLRTQ